MSATLEQIDEQSLVRLVKKKDVSAQNLLWESSAGYLGAVCGRYVSDDQAVQDILQEAYIKIFTKIGSFTYRGKGSLKAWMTRIVVNDSLKYLRRSRPVSLDKILPVMSDIPEEDEDPGLEGVPAEVIFKMIRSLPEGYRTVFNLYAIEQRSHKEIAAILGIKENSSASQYFRAKAMLSKMIRDYKNRQDNE